MTAGGATIALRVPAHPVARALLREVGVPIAAPSANRSSSVSPTTAAHVLKTLDGRIDAVLDGGASARGIESTIVDVTRAPAIVLRPGAIAREAIAALIDVEDGGHRVEPVDQPARAPGGLARHYAPRARVILVAASAVAADVEALRAAGRARRRARTRAGDGDRCREPREVLASRPDAFAARALRGAARARRRGLRGHRRRRAARPGPVRGTPCGIGCAARPPGPELDFRARAELGEQRLIRARRTFLVALLSGPRATASFASRRFAARDRVGPERPCPRGRTSASSAASRRRSRRSSLRSRSRRRPGPPPCSMIGRRSSTSSSTIPPPRGSRSSPRSTTRRSSGPGRCARICPAPGGAGGRAPGGR